MTAFNRPAEQNQAPFLMVMGGLIALAWLSLWLLERSPYARFVSHDHHAGSAGFIDSPGVALLFIGGWTLMVIAMMLPTTLPLVSLFRGIVRRRRNATELVAVLLTGYILAWAGFGFIVHLADWGVHLVIDQSRWLSANAWVLASGTLVVAGLYQFSEMKYRCLDKCRSPYSFIMNRWQGKNSQNESLRIGIHHGFYCIGCCWSLMLLMFAVGVGNLAWMLLLGAVMAIEKNVQWGRRLVRPLGFILLAWGGTTLALGLTGTLATH